LAGQQPVPDAAITLSRCFRDDDSVLLQPEHSIAYTHKAKVPRAIELGSRHIFNPLQLDPSRHPLSAYLLITTLVALHIYDKVISTSAIERSR
jgi:hypothetical protein